LAFRFTARFPLSVIAIALAIKMSPCLKRSAIEGRLGHWDQSDAIDGAWR
jgi:hypothetical protein